jgi:ABC-type uncharacterized transport system substrate-binding protein
LTGFVAAAPETAAKRAQVMKEIMPQSRRAAVLWNPASSNAQLEWKAVRETASALEITFTLHEARTARELESALAEIPKARPDMIVVINDPFMFTFRRSITDAAADASLPAIYGYREYVDDGGLISYGASITQTYRRAADYVEKILKGANPGDLPIESPTKFELVINLKTAKALGLEVPPTLLARADEVIE